MNREDLHEESGIEPAVTRPLEAKASKPMAILATMIKRTNQP